LEKDGKVTFIYLIVGHIRGRTLDVAHYVEKRVEDTSLAVKGCSKPMMYVATNYNRGEMLEAHWLVIH